MPIPPSFISLSTARNIAARHLRKFDQNQVLAMLVDALCDGALEAWGCKSGEVPHRISVQDWINCKYANINIGCDVIEIEIFSFLIWLGIVPLNWREMPAGDLQSAVENALRPEVSVAQSSQPTEGKRPPIPKPTLVKHLEKIKRESRRVPAADLLFPEVVRDHPQYHVTRSDVRAVAQEVWGKQQRGRRRKSAS